MLLCQKNKYTRVTLKYILSSLTESFTYNAPNERCNIIVNYDKRSPKLRSFIITHSWPYRVGSIPGKSTKSEILVYKEEKRTGFFHENNFKKYPVDATTKKTLMEVIFLVHSIFFFSVSCLVCICFYRFCYTAS